MVSDKLQDSYGRNVNPVYTRDSPNDDLMWVCCLTQYTSIKASVSTSDVIKEVPRGIKEVVVNHCFTSLFSTNGLLSDIVIR